MLLECRNYIMKKYVKFDHITTALALKENSHFTKKKWLIILYIISDTTIKYIATYCKYIQVNFLPSANEVAER